MNPLFVSPQHALAIQWITVRVFAGLIGQGASPRSRRGRGVFIVVGVLTVSVGGLSSQTLERSSVALPIRGGVCHRLPLWELV